MPSPAAPLFTTLLVSALCAQRAKPTFEFEKRSLTVNYGATKVGKHTLSGLPVGERWRLGSNEATTFQVGMPLICGQQVVAPGEYRLVLYRTSETDLGLGMTGAGWALGRKESDMQLLAKLEKSEKPTDKLVIEWQAQQKPEGTTQAVVLRTQFGANQFVLPFTAIAAKTLPKALPGWIIDVYQYPPELLQKRIDADQETPIATFHKRTGGKPEIWNLLVSKTKCWFVPQIKAPTDSFGFADLEELPAEKKAEGKVTWEGAVGEGSTTLELRAAKRSAKREIEIQFWLGTKEGKVTWQEPKGS